MVDISPQVWYGLVMDRNGELERVARWYEDFYGTPEVCNDVVAYAVAHLGFEGRSGFVTDGDVTVWHCWLVEAGEVIDPTVHQFDGPINYPAGDPFIVTWEVELIA